MPPCPGSRCSRRPARRRRVRDVGNVEQCQEGHDSPRLTLRRSRPSSTRRSRSSRSPGRTPLSWIRSGPGTRRHAAAPAAHRGAPGWHGRRGPAIARRPPYPLPGPCRIGVITLAGCVARRVDDHLLAGWRNCSMSLSLMPWKLGGDQALVPRASPLASKRTGPTIVFISFLRSIRQHPGPRCSWWR